MSDLQQEFYIDNDGDLNLEWFLDSNNLLDVVISISDNCMYYAALIKGESTYGRCELAYFFPPEIQLLINRLEAN